MATASSIRRAENKKAKEGSLLTQARTFAVKTVEAGNPVHVSDLVAKAGITPEAANACLISIAAQGTGTIRMYQRRGAVLCPGTWHS